MPVYTTMADYTGNGATQTYAVPFPYIAQADVEVYVAGVIKVLTTDYTWANSGQIHFNSAPADTLSIRIKRNTPKATQAVTFTNGSVLQGSDLNHAILQLLYAQQELVDYSVETLANANAVVSTTGNVPAPSSPSDDNKVLMALSGGWGWSSGLTLSTATIAALTATSATISAGTVNVTSTATVTLTVSGASSLTTLTVSGATTAGAITSSGAVQAASFGATGSATASTLTATTSITAGSNGTVDIGTSLVKFANIWLSVGGLHNTRIGATVKATSVTVGTGTAGNEIAFDTLDDDSTPTGSSASWTGGDPSALYIRKTGLYLVTGCLITGAPSGTKRIQLQLSSGSPAVVARQTTTGATSCLSTSALLRLTAGQYIQLRADKIGYTTTENFTDARLSAYWIGD